MKLKKYLALGLALMGLVHIAATFTPVIAGKLEALDMGAQRAFLYMSLMCGALLLLGGMILYLLLDKKPQTPFLKRPLLLVELILALDGILAAVMMPTNPCAWVILVLSLALLLVRS